MRPRADGRSLLWRERKRERDFGGERVRIAGLDEPAGEARRPARRIDRLRQRSEIADDDRAAHGLRLDAGPAEGFRDQRGKDRDMGGEEGRRHVVTMTDK